MTGHNFNAGPVAHQALVQWLDGRADESRPFFAYLSYMEAHIPRVPSLAARKKVADDATIRVATDTDFQLDNQLLYVQGTFESAESGPTAASIARYQALRAQLDRELAALDAVIAGELAAFNRLVAERQAPAVIVVEPK